MKVFAITFYGVVLPRAACFIDVAFKLKIVTSLSEEMAVWFWRFTICKDGVKEAPSTEVLQHVLPLVEFLDENGSQVRAELEDRYGEGRGRQIFDDWRQTLRIITESASTSDLCQWIGTEDLLY
jgi:hypothetical protein